MPVYRPMPPAERVRELLDYEPDTGIFRRKVRAANISAGSIAGVLRPSGYIVFSIDNRLYRAHQIAWLWMTGEWPPSFLDHKDMNKSNNRWSNLRLATKSQNHANRGRLRTNTSGLKGTFFYKAYQRWTSQIWKDRKAHFLGYFDTAEEAHQAYCAKGRELYGEFWRDN